ncbi:MAG: VOC family protein [Rhodoferax sp.]|nr:VOC family protein [Rhodoferax sp.]MDP3650721.1 VOC family protein [Rhodoferax sp.]
MATLHPFHLAFPVQDLAATRIFYGDVLGCVEGRSTEEWIDYDFFGHQITAHLAPAQPQGGGKVDGTHVSVPHFGAVFPMDQWQALSDRLTVAGAKFAVQSHTRFQGQVGEQSTLFLHDPSGNALEFKGFNDMGQLFAK